MARPRRLRRATPGLSHHALATACPVCAIRQAGWFFTTIGGPRRGRAPCAVLSDTGGLRSGGGPGVATASHQNERYIRDGGDYVFVNEFWKRHRPRSGCWPMSSHLLVTMVKLLRVAGRCALLNARTTRKERTTSGTERRRVVTFCVVRLRCDTGRGLVGRW
jgi:hypothetical protein